MATLPLLRSIAARAASAALLLGVAGVMAAPPGAVVSTPEVRAELIAHAPAGVRPGQPLWLGLRFEHAPDWHTYWANPGDSGLPTVLTWDLPPGLRAGELRWPVPQRLPIGPLVNFGYGGTVLLPTAVQVDRAPATDSVAIRLHAEWLVCKTVCIPQSGDFQIDVPVRTATVPHAARFDAAAAAMPQPQGDVRASARLDEGARTLQLQIDGLPPTMRMRRATVFPELSGVLDNAAAVPQQWQGGVFSATLPVSAQRSEGPDALPLVLAFEATAHAVRVLAQVQGAWPAIGSAPAAGLDAGSEAGAAAQPGFELGFLLAMAMALAGGALLNLMPCVFPVLSLKLLALARSEPAQGSHLGTALAFTAGVVLSFVALAALLHGLRLAGEQVGWGFQLQSSGVVAGLAGLFTLIGLNLAGVFELAVMLPTPLATLRARHPAVDAALTGVLAVAVASPCTAPFMGAALGAALTWPAPQALAVFAALGLGMALPFAALCLWPGLARHLPRPGAWMLRVRVALAFPMFATVVWLVWVFGQQTGIDGAAALLALLLSAAAAAWLWGQGQHAAGHRAAWRVSSLAAGLAVVLGVVWAAPSWQVQRAGTLREVDTAWAPWSSATVAQLRAQGKPVFVDFTAAWCVTCQFNKRLVLSDAQLLADLQVRGVTLLRADWTRRDAAIAAELARLGRSGVPVYVLYRGARSPRMLSELLTIGEVRAAISDL